MIKVSVGKKKKKSCSINAVGKTGKQNYLEEQKTGDECP